MLRARITLFPSRSPAITFLVAALAFYLVNISWAAEPASQTPDGNLLVVRVKRTPDDAAWETYQTRTIERLPGFAPGKSKIRTCQYGGWLDKKTRASGFFRVEKQGDRWWLVDPDGCLFIHVGICHVGLAKSPTVVRSLKEKFGDATKWAEQTTQMLWDCGFNGTGAWSDTETLRKTSHPLPYTLGLGFMGRFAQSKKLPPRVPGHSAYPNDCILIFHPEFESFCDTQAQPLAATKADPYLVGHFSDNELPASADLLDKFLALNAKHPDLAPNRRAAEEWLVKRKGAGAGIKNVTDDDRRAWIEHVFYRYFAITTGAIRKYDPNHLCLGPRLHSWARQSTEIFRVAGKYLDAIAVNYYRAWSPNPAWLAMWTRESGRPVMITEFYAKGVDSGLPNRTGAGWLVPTQGDRGLFYQNYVLGLLESKTCVGWHWFKYMDNDPEDLTADPSNKDSNKGIVTIRFEPYEPLLKNMRALNSNVYAIIQHLDSTPAVQ